MKSFKRNKRKAASFNRESLDKWLEYWGTICPFCKIGLAESECYGSFEVCEDTVYQEMFCPSCDKKWDNAYRLSNPVMYDITDEELGIIEQWNEDNCLQGDRLPMGEDK